MCRPRSLLLLLALASPCRAGYIDLVGGAGNPGDVVLAGNGNFSGSSAIATATGGDTPLNAGRTFSLVGVAAFSFRPASSGDLDSQFSYLPGGSLTLLGSFDGGPVRTLISSTFYSSQAITDGRGHWRIDGGQFGGTIAPEIASAFGVITFAGGQLSVSFTLPPGQAGESLASVTSIRLLAVAVPVPEPASAVLVALAAPLVLAWRSGHQRGRGEHRATVHH